MLHLNKVYKHVYIYLSTDTFLSHPILSCAFRSIRSHTPPSRWQVCAVYLSHQAHYKNSFEQETWRSEINETDLSRLCEQWRHYDGVYYTYTNTYIDIYCHWRNLLLGFLHFELHLLNMRTCVIHFYWILIYLLFGTITNLDNQA